MKLEILWMMTGLILLGPFGVTQERPLNRLSDQEKREGWTLLFDRGHVEHWLNGAKIVEFEAWSEDWDLRRRKGKWKDHPDYGRANRGHIGLQDHGNKIWFRNIKVKKL